jgi:NAD(P)H dehydrogenase (quinone)
MSIAIAGASGNLGRTTADFLLETLDPRELVLVTRDPAKLESYAARGVDVRHGDFDDPGTLPAAFAGVERLLLISATDIGRRVAQHTAAIDAARAAGVHHVLYTSITNPIEANPVVVAAEHRATEEALQASGMAWTFLRNSIYAEVQAGAILGSLATGQFVHNAGDGVCAYIAREDCAAVAAAVLRSAGHEFQAYDVTGPELLSSDDMVRIASELTGTPITAVAVDDDAYVAGLVANAGLPAELAASVATFGQAVRDGYHAQLTDVVERLTGRRPIPFADIVAATAPVAA